MIISAYVAGPFSGKTRADVDFNIGQAEQVGLFLTELGVYPVIPHCNTSHPNFEKLQPYPFWIEATLDLMLMCDVVFCMGNWSVSSGATKERAKALEIHMPVFYTLDSLKEALPRLIALKQSRVLPEKHWTYQAFLDANNLNLKSAL